MSFYEDKSVLVTGGHGFLGKHLVRKLNEQGVYEIAVPTHKELELQDMEDVYNYVDGFAPDVIFHLAARVGGIHYNMANPATLIYQNTLMAINIVKMAQLVGAKLVAAGSVCAYPEYTPTPTIEGNLFNGYPEKSNGAYGNAKRMLLELQRAYYDQYDLLGAHLVSSNLYGPGDSFDPANSHVVPALIVKIQNAIDNNQDQVVIWGTGQASRDLLYVEDAAEAYLVAGEHIDYPEPINIASDRETPIHFIASKLIDIMGFVGEIVYDKSKPNGQLRRRFRTHRMTELTGWTSETGLDEGLSHVVDYYRTEIHEGVPF